MASLTLYKVRSKTDPEIGILHEWSTRSSNVTYVTLMLWRDSSLDIHNALIALSSLSAVEIEHHLFRAADGFCSADSSWIESSLLLRLGSQNRFFSCIYGGVIPCYKLYDGSGRSLSAVLQFRIPRIGMSRSKHPQSTSSTHHTEFRMGTNKMDYADEEVLTSDQGDANNTEAPESEEAHSGRSSIDYSAFAAGTQWD